jgi:hypothetical protein
MVAASSAGNDWPCWLRSQIVLSFAGFKWEDQGGVLTEGPTGDATVLGKILIDFLPV